MAELRIAVGVKAEGLFRRLDRIRFSLKEMKSEPGEKMRKAVASAVSAIVSEKFDKASAKYQKGSKRIKVLTWMFSRNVSVPFRAEIESFEDGDKLSKSVDFLRPLVDSGALRTSLRTGAPGHRSEVAGKTIRVFSDLPYSNKQALGGQATFTNKVKYKSVVGKKRKAIDWDSDTGKRILKFVAHTDKGFAFARKLHGYLARNQTRSRKVPARPWLTGLTDRERQSIRSAALGAISKKLAQITGR